MSNIGDTEERFRCPKCWSYCYFISSGPQDSLVRKCTGPDSESACGFKWPMADDHKYFETWQRTK